MADDKKIGFGSMSKKDREEMARRGGHASGGGRDKSQISDEETLLEE